MTSLVTGIGGLFFRAKDPEALSAWYTEHFDIQNVQTAGIPWQQSGGFTVFQPFPENSDYFSSDKSFMLNFRVSDLDAMIAKLEAAGLSVETRPDEWDNPAIGRFGRLHDPEGNPIELWQPAS